MISIDKLRAVKKVYTHASCPDGISSALILKDALPDVEVTFMAHGTKEHRSLEPLPGTLFCDFTPYVGDTSKGLNSEPGSVLDCWLKEGAILLDHHPTQRDVTMQFVEAGLGAYGENDRNECGAWLAYEHVWLPTYLDEGGSEDDEVTEWIRRFAELAGIRDTWKKDHADFKLACEQAEILMFWEYRLLDRGGWSRDELYDEFCPEHRSYLGNILFAKKLEHARKAIGEAHRFATEKGTRVLMFQGVTPTSDAAEILEKAGPGWTSQGVEVKPTDIVAGFHYRVDAGRLKLQFSTRSHTGYDVGAFCKSKGGGGHRAAAGFTVEQNAELGANPYQVFRGILEEWELGQ